MIGILAAADIGKWPVIRQLAWLFGKVMNSIYNFMDDVFHIQNIGVCIIIFTAIVFTILIPFTIKQQKWSKMSFIMQPELRKVQKKYAGKKDQVSMVKQQEEMQAVYDKYGTSMMGGCLPALIPMPVLFSLYPVIQEIPNYITRIKDIYMKAVTPIMNTEGFQAVMEEIGSAKPVLLSPKLYEYSKPDTLVNVLYRFQGSTWETLIEKMPQLKDIAEQTMQATGHINMFLGINLAISPMNMLTAAFKDFSILGIFLAVLIPILSGATQFLNMKLMPQPAGPGEDSVTNSTKGMNYIMPLFSVFIGFTLPAGLGLFWAVSAVVRSIHQVIINKQIDKIPIEKLIEENKKKAEKKLRKKGTPASQVNRMATTSTKNYSTHSSSMTETQREALLRIAREKAKNAVPGSLAERANMVSRFNAGQSLNESEKEKNK